MPYIATNSRARAETMPLTPGELNYAITILCKDYLAAAGLSYQHINDVLGALEGAKQEFYRRVAVPYEDGKIAENGDVY
jgi:hypothetical protein